jgi:hypothetical protein
LSGAERAGKKEKGERFGSAQGKQAFALPNAVIYKGNYSTNYGFVKSNSLISAVNKINELAGLDEALCSVEIAATKPTGREKQIPHPAKTAGVRDDSCRVGGNQDEMSAQSGTLFRAYQRGYGPGSQASSWERILPEESVSIWAWTRMPPLASRL